MQETILDFEDRVPLKFAEFIKRLVAYFIDILPIVKKDGNIPQ